MPPLSLLIKPVSGRCNMRCKYCFYADEVSGRASGDAGVMTGRTLENLTARAFRYAEDAVYFAFQGGEPTLAGTDFYRQALALHRETAVLLELRARHATTPQQRDLLLRRAQNRRLVADRLRSHLDRSAAEQRHPSAHA